MQNPVVIKGNKAGMTVYLIRPFPLQSFGGGKKEIQGRRPGSGGSAQMTLTLGGKEAVAWRRNFLWSTPSQKIPGSRSLPHRRGCGTDPQVREGVK